MTSHDRAHRNHYEGEQAHQRLASLGLRLDILIEAVRVGEMERRSAHRYEPSGSPGFKDWVGKIRQLSIDLVPLGWVPNETYGLPRLENLERGIALTVGRGDDGTGRPWRTPRSKNPRGAASALCVRTNGEQLHLFDTAAAQSASLVTYWLLTYSDESVLRSELSIPIDFADGQFVAWDDRIFLPEISLAPAPDASGDEPLGSFDVPVRPRF